MKFKYYFLKQGDRLYDKTELITLLSNHIYITPPDKKDPYGNTVYTYHHHVLNFEAKFVISDRAVVPNIHEIDPGFYDVNFYIEFDVLVSDYAADLIIDIVEEICKRFRFYVYNQYYGNPKPFKRPELMKIFKSWKKSHADNHPEIISKYNYLDPQTLGFVYGYLLKRKRIELHFSKTKTQVSNYMFLCVEKSRSAFVGVKWDGSNDFILPPGVDILYFDNGKYRKYYSVPEIMQKASKLFKPIDGFGKILILEGKAVKKFSKILTKEKFKPLQFTLEQLSIDKILDI